MKKKIFCLLLAFLLLFCPVGLSAFAEDSVMEIQKEEDLINLFEKGGKGKLTGSLFLSQKELSIRNFTDVSLEIGSFPLIFDQCQVKISGNLTVSSSDEIHPGQMIFTDNREMESFLIPGKLILEHVNLNAGIIFGGGTIYPFCCRVFMESFDGNVIGFNQGAYEYGNPHYLDHEIYTEIFENKNLVSLQTQKAKAEKWLDENHKEVTTWTDDGKNHSYNPVWVFSDSPDSGYMASIFGEGKLWMVFTFLFAGTSILFSVLYLKEKKKTGKNKKQ